MELIVCCTVSIIGHVLMAFSQSYLSCICSLSPWVYLELLVANTSMSLSVSRCYIKKRAEESKFVNPKNIIKCIKTTKIVCYLWSSIILCACVWFKIDSAIIECANVPFYEKNSNPYVYRSFASVNLILFFGQFLATIASEITLKRIFDARRSNKYHTNQSALTPWTNVGTNLDSNQKFQRNKIPKCE